MVPGTITPFTNMVKQRLIPRGIFSVQLRPRRVIKTATLGGVFVFGGTDQNLFQGAITFTPVTKKLFWQIAITRITFNGVVVGGQSQQFIVDTATTLLVIGTQVAKTIHTKMGGRFDLNTRTWQIPCKATVGKLAIVINGVPFQINPLDIMRERISSTSSFCFSGIAPTDGNVWILGGVFLKNVYAIFDREKDRVGFALPKYS